MALTKLEPRVPGLGAGLEDRRHRPVPAPLHARQRRPVPLEVPRRPSTASRSRRATASGCCSTCSARACCSASRSSPATRSPRSRSRARHIQLQKGPLRWVLRSGRLRTSRSLDGQTLNGLRITGAPKYLELPDQRRQPDELLREAARRLRRADVREADRAHASARPGQHDREGRRRRGRVQLHRPERLDRPDRRSTAARQLRRRGPVGDRGQRQLPGPRRLRRRSRPASTRATSTTPAPRSASAHRASGPFGPVFLQRIKFRVEVNPKKSECVPHLGVETEEFLGYTFTTDYGVPTFALCGEVGLTGGPQFLGAEPDLARRRASASPPTTTARRCCAPTAT